MSKEMFIEEYDRILDECEEEGLTHEAAHKKADAGAYQAMSERYAAMIDRAKDEWKYRDIK
jgi:hypothetical protein